MTVWRKIERAAKQPLRDRAERDLLGATVGEIRNALLQLGGQGMNLRSEDVVRGRVLGVAVERQPGGVSGYDSCERLMEMRRDPGAMN